MSCHEVRHLRCMCETHTLSVHYVLGTVHRYTICTTENACYQELSTILGYVVSTQKRKKSSAFLTTSVNTTALPLEFKFLLVAITYH